MSEARKKRVSKEKRLAAYYQQHKGDTSIWEAQSTPAEKPKEPAVVFSIRLTPDELENIRKEADERGIPATAIVRTAIIERHLQCAGIYTFGPQVSGRTIAMIPGNVINATEYFGQTAVTCMGFTEFAEFGGRSWEASDYTEALTRMPLFTVASYQRFDPKGKLIGPLQIPVP